MKALLHILKKCSKVLVKNTFEFQIVIPQLPTSKQCILHYPLSILSSWRPIQLPPTQNMQMQMINTLRSLLSIIHHNPESLGTLLLPHFGRNHHQMSQNLLMILRRTTNLGQSLTLLRNHQNMGGGLRSNIPKGQCVFIFVDFIGGPFARKDFVKYCIRSGVIEGRGLIGCCCFFGFLDLFRGRGGHASV